MQINVKIPTTDAADEWSQYCKSIHSDSANRKRKAQSKIVSDYYDGTDQLSYLESEFTRIFTDADAVKKKRKITVNLTKFVVNSVATTYAARVKRLVNGLTPEQADLLSKSIWADLDNQLSTANKLLVHQRTTLVQLFWSEDNLRVGYRSYPQYLFDVVFDPASEDRKLMAVILSDYKPNDYAGTSFRVYTGNKFYRFQGAKLISETEQGLDFLPFVMLYETQPSVDTDYLMPRSDLSQYNLEFNVLQSNTLHLTHRQAHGILVLKTPDFGQSAPAGHASGDNTDAGTGNTIPPGGRHINLGPDTLLELPISPGGVEPSLEYVSQTPDFAGQINVANQLLQMLSINMGLPIDTFGVAATSQGSTATEFFVKQKRLVDSTKHFDNIFSHAERELFKKAHFISQSHMTLPDIRQDQFSIEFAHENPMPESDDPAHSIILYDKNIIDEVEVLRREYPHLNRSEAEAFYNVMRDTHNKLNSLIVPDGNPAQE